MEKKWKPPMKNCGLCGVKTCKDFMKMVKDGKYGSSKCVFYPMGKAKMARPADKCAHGSRDVLGGTFDFIVNPLPGEISARKIVQPFRPDLVEKWGIKKGDIVVGRPQSAGCPIPHVLQVIKANYTTGVLDTWCVGPAYSRDRKVYDFESYVMLAFEGIAEISQKAPAFGHRQRFLPGFCMMNVAHTGVVNMVLEKSYGLHVRVEDIRLL